MKWISWCLFFTLALMYTIGNKSQSFVFLLSHLWGTSETHRCLGGVVAVFEGQASALELAAEGLNVLWFRHTRDLWPAVWRSLMLFLLFSSVAHYLSHWQCHFILTVSGYCVQHALGLWHVSFLFGSVHEKVYFCMCVCVCALILMFCLYSLTSKSFKLWMTRRIHQWLKLHLKNSAGGNYSDKCNFPGAGQFDLWPQSLYMVTLTTL